LLRNGKKIYALAELARLTGLSDSALRRAVHRLQQYRYLFRLKIG